MQDPPRSPKDPKRGEKGSKKGSPGLAAAPGGMSMEATSGFEPLDRGFADPRLNLLATSPLPFPALLSIA